MINEYGQCGDGTDVYVDEPKVIEALKEYKVDIIRCGAAHSFCRTQCGKHFLFGSNWHEECLSMDRKVVRPHCIDKVVQTKHGKKIFSVHPGCGNTFILCSFNDSE